MANDTTRRGAGEGSPATCVYVCICMSSGVCFMCAFKKKEKNRVGAICMGLMHGTAQCQQEQYNAVVKAMSQPFVRPDNGTVSAS